jgi:hypothetical protein
MANNIRNPCSLKYYFNKLSKVFHFTGVWKKLYNEELHNFYSSPDIIRMIKSRRMRWAGHVARTGDMRNAYKHFGWKEKTRKT